MIASHFLELADRRSVLDALTRFDETRLLADLRRERNDSPAWRDVLSEVALHLLQKHGLNPFARAAGTAALLDVGRHDVAASCLAEAFARDIAADADLRVTARLFRDCRRPAVANHLHQIADTVAQHGRTVPTDLAAQLAAALRGNVALPPAPLAIGPENVAPRTALHEPTPVPSESGLVLRPLLSRQQVGRAAHALKNCSGDLFKLIRSGAITLYVLDVDGVPTEMIEVFMDDGRIGRWLGVANRPPDELRKLRIERWMVIEGLAVGN